MLNKGLELWAAAAAIIIITAIYAGVVILFGSIPAAGDLSGGSFAAHRPDPG